MEKRYIYSNRAFVTVLALSTHDTCGESIFERKAYSAATIGSSGRPVRLLDRHRHAIAWPCLENKLLKSSIAKSEIPIRPAYSRRTVWFQVGAREIKVSDSEEQYNLELIHGQGLTKATAWPSLKRTPRMSWEILSSEAIRVKLIWVREYLLIHMHCKLHRAKHLSFGRVLPASIREKRLCGVLRATRVPNGI
jgi:hypothetical protein